MSRIERVMSINEKRAQRALGLLQIYYWDDGINNRIEIEALTYWDARRMLKKYIRNRKKN